MRKRVLAGGVLLLCVAVLALVVVWQRKAPPAPGVTGENFRRLHKGMSQEQVELILGAPSVEEKGRWFGLEYTDCTWEGESGYGIRMTFMPREAVDGDLIQDEGIMDVLRDKPVTLLEWVRSWLPWSEPEE
jgi:hypothetical protein